MEKIELLIGECVVICKAFTENTKNKNETSAPIKIPLFIAINSLFFYINLIYYFFQVTFSNLSWLEKNNKNLNMLTSDSIYARQN